MKGAENHPRESLHSRFFDTDAKNFYVEREVAHLDAGFNGTTIEVQTATMDIQRKSA